MVFYYNVLNVLACIAVIMLHCNSCFWNGPGAGESLWATSAFIEAAMYWAVPVFYMLTGAKLMDYRERMTTKEYFKRRFMGVAVPFAAWSLIGVIYTAFRRPDQLEWNLSEIINNILNTNYINVYWFFATLFCIYLSIPFWSMFQDKLNVFKYLIIATFVFESALPLLCKFIGVNFPEISPMVASGYSIFAVVGYYLANVEISKDKRKIIYLLAILGVAAHFLGTWLLSTPETGISLLFKGYANAPSFLYAVGVFVFFKYFNYDKLPGKKLINYLSKLTFGIYLMHIYVVWEAPGLLGFNNCSLVWRTAGALGVFILCAIVTGIIKKIPVVNKILVP